MKHLLRQLLLPLALGPITMAAQQAETCNACACGFTGLFNVASNLYTTTLAGHDAAFPNYGWSQTYSNSALFHGRFHRVYLRGGDQYTFSLCASSQDTYLWVTNNAATPVVYACDDDGCGTPNGPSTLTFTAPINGIYRLYAYDDACGTPLGEPLVPPSPNLSLTMTRNAPQPPPANDEPCGAIALPMNASCSFTFANSTAASLSVIAGAGTAPAGCVGSPLLQNDVWFTTTVPASGLIGINVEEGSICASSFNLYTATACNGTFTQLPGSCAMNGPSGPTTEPAIVYNAFAAGLSVGQTVYIRFWERNGDENGTYGICAYEAQRPVNDNPCGAIDLPVNIGCTFTNTSTENATPLSGVTVTPNPVVAGCGGPATNDLWFRVLVTPAMAANGFTVNTTAGTLADAAMAIYRVTSGSPTCPTGLNQLACNNNQSGSNVFPRINLAPGVPLAGEYLYIRVWPQTPWEGTFGICAIQNQPPPNNLPCGAIPLPVNYGCILSTFSNENATTITAPFPNGNFWNNSPNPVAPCASAQWFDDVWFTVVMPPNGTIQLDTYAGTLNTGGMALYSATGSCGAGNLTLTQVACATTGSQQGSPNMPYINYTNVSLAGQTLYVRLSRRGLSSTQGNFGICARRTDPPPTNCFYTLTLNDSGGNGWDGSFVRVCVGGVCTNYTVNGSSSSINIGTNIGQVFTVQYFINGAGFQNQNSFSISQFGQPVYLSGNAPFQGFHFVTTVDCTPPPAPQSDCLGAFQLCNQNITVNQNPTNIGNLQDLNPSNRGCLSANERQGLWYYFTAQCAGNIAFTITPTGTADYDFAVWGPFPSLTCGSGLGPPLRCSWAAPSFPGSPTGLAINPTLPISENAFGTGFVRHITASPGDVYVLYVDNYSMNGVQFNLSWNAGNTVCPTTLQNPTGSIVACTTLPIDLIEFDARPWLDHVEVIWKTATEKGSDHFEVQRSADGRHYEAIGRLPAAGNSVDTRSYHLVDDAPLEGLSWYRLKQVDVDGTAQFFDPRTVLLGARRGSLTVFPNPADDRLNVVYTARDEAAVTWRLRDASGRLVREGVHGALEGSNRLSIDVRTLDPGGYLLELSGPNGPVGNARFMRN
jgi:hypothetical protein